MELSLKEGVLWKRTRDPSKNNFSNWKLRLCRLIYVNGSTPTLLLTWCNPEKQSPSRDDVVRRFKRREIQVTDYDISEDSTLDKNARRFSFLLMPKRPNIPTFSLAALTQTDKEDWMGALQNLHGKSIWEIDGREITRGKVLSFGYDFYVFSFKNNDSILL
jgi:hypothetical protein